MKIVIAEVATPRDGLLAAGMRQWLDQAGIEHETVDNPAGMIRQPVESADPPELPRAKRGRPAGKRGKAAKKASAHNSAEGGRVVKAAAPVKPAPVKAPRKASAPSSDGAPRLTIRQRVMNILKAGGEQTAAEVHSQLVKAGLSPLIDTAQHLYLLKRDNLVRFGEHEGYVLA